MNSAPIQLTIDLDAAIKKIAQRQSLNDVHFAVQLVRHALTHNPNKIHVKTRGRYYEIRHDGAPIHAAEMQLLESIIEKQNQCDVYEALGVLERDHGIALLSIMINQTLVEIRSENRLIRVSSGVWQETTPRHPIRGTQIRIQRPSKQARRENRELRFFCEFSDIPIFLNGRQICRAPELDGQILEGKVRQHQGTGWIGIPGIGHLSRIVFLKRGIRFGSQHFLEKRGHVFHAIWNSNVSTFEDDFSVSIRNGRKCLQESIPSLYETLVRHFGDMDETQKNRVKRLVFSMGSDAWDSSTEQIPIFPSPAKEFDLSIRDLKSLANKFGVIPFFLPPAPKQAPRFPVLRAEDLYFIRTQMNLRAKHVHLWGVRKTEPPRDANANFYATSETTQDPFFGALNAKPGWTFQFIQGPASRSFMDKQGVRRVFVSPQDPVYHQARIRYQQDPGVIDLLRYQLWNP